LIYKLDPAACIGVAIVSFAVVGGAGDGLATTVDGLSVRARNAGEEEST
jgi:hypothetical protein